MDRTPVWKKAELIGLTVIVAVTGALLWRGVELTADYYWFMTGMGTLLCGGKLVANKINGGGNNG